MAVFKQGDMFNASGFIIISANSSLTKGKLVMDRDAKRKLNKRVSGIDRIFGQMILETCGDLGIYGLLLYREYGVLQVGYGRNEINLNLFKFSMSKLSEKARANWNEVYNINGIGNGRHKGNYLRVAEMLPDNVYVWRKENDAQHNFRRSMGPCKKGISGSMGISRT